MTLTASAPPATGRLLPGLVLTAVAVGVALVVNRLVPALSPAVVAVTLGAILANTAGVGPSVAPGVRFVSRTVLRSAIVLLGLQIAVPDVLALGWQPIVIIALATGLTFTLTPLLGRRLGLSPGASLLVATGVSICGAAAVAGMHEATGGEGGVSDDDDVAGALSVVVLYGTALIVLLPLIASWLGLSARQLGVWTGASVHEVAQVAAIGAATGGAVLAVAVTVKLARVMLLAPVVALTMLWTGLSRRRSTPLVPLFVLGFLAMVAVRSTGLAPQAVTDVAPQVSGLLLAAALFGLGTGIDVRKLLRGGRALLLGALSTALIGTFSLALVAVLV
ncbi:YeiH family protein [Nonomuraea africana]|uniref:Integral membrane protein (TIGR00698 family) n=1 Tax=Nonomuraea africana TaxID=46171 RepID=A0ABR9K9H3_9ACTN|nr:putative sulfate exporter family transporter [Nonomuraea africana]MBE1558647.1 putative integral membrane protein (TIGR00698 family) [Nonomuraea africana]